MSVGGIIVGLTIKGDEAHVTVAERAPWKKTEPKLDLRNATAVWVKHGGHSIALGDKLWCQGRRAYWTPQHVTGGKQGKDYEIVLERTSYSHEGQGWPAP